LAGFWELLFIGSSIPASANGANSKRVLRHVLGADEFLHPTGFAYLEWAIVQVKRILDRAGREGWDNDRGS
jgi:hypothetical protein